ncbi:hypothetical protein BP00DRAFT_480917 [Aspergillus indologenus CBS 114.80]|uniref:Uncharacterized protein n=1 Tax=Aspergillus indologenus CBS 114.80 TaxID=1450541 RepID=A0A2V5IJ88_9EURO|nr:hypothetical protein BP00DRAFT_480917 [Aspergillus indologenus CBS 114.80]
MSFAGTWSLTPEFASEHSSEVALGNIIADPCAPDSPLQQVKPEDLTDFPIVQDEDAEGRYRLQSFDGSPLDLGVGARILHSLSFAVWHQRPAGEFADHCAVGVRTRKLAPNFPWIELRPFLERQSTLAYLISGRPLYVVSGIMIARNFRRHALRNQQPRTDLGFGFGNTPVQSFVHFTGTSPPIRDNDFELNDVLFAYRLHKVTLDSGPQEPQIQAQVYRSPAAFASVHHDRTYSSEEEGEEEEETGSGPGQAVRVDEMTSEDWSHHDFQILPSVREETQGQTHTPN